MARKVVSSLREDWLKNFARYLRSKRKKSRLSQKDLAQSVSISVHTVRKMESGSFVPSRELANDLGEVFEEPYTAVAAAGYIPFLGWRPC